MPASDLFTIHLNYFYSHCITMDECPPLPMRCSITNLPPEIILGILSKLADLESLLSTIQSCRYLYQIFKNQNDGGRAVIESIFSRILLLESAPEKICNAITFALHHECVPHVAANSLFWQGWGFFKDGIPEMPKSDVSWAYAVLCLPQSDQRLLIDIANGRRLTQRSTPSAKHYKRNTNSEIEIIKPPFDLILLGRLLKEPMRILIASSDQSLAGQPHHCETSYPRKDKTGNLRGIVRSLAKVGLYQTDHNLNLSWRRMLGNQSARTRQYARSEDLPAEVDWCRYALHRIRSYPNICLSLGVLERRPKNKWPHS
jgi:hypothetical protein